MFAAADVADTQARTERPTTVALVPVYNEQATVVAVLGGVANWVDRIIAVDDGSSDGSATSLDDWATGGPGRTVLHHPRNRGMSQALLSGFSYLVLALRDGYLKPEDLLIMIDADGQHLPEEIPRLVKRLTDHDLDVVLGRRGLSGYPFGKRFGNRALSWWASLLGGQPYEDAESGFRVMRLETVRRLLPYFTALAYGCAQELAVLTARQGARVDNTEPVTIRYYRKGVRHRDGITNALMALVAFARSFTRPRLDAVARASAVLRDVRVVGGWASGR
ncbi:MAG: glycosyltransferase family 2 protein [Sulfobacillus sp.]